MMRQVQEALNIIMVSKEGIFLKKEDQALEVSLSDKLDFYDIVKMNIEVKKDTSLQICYRNSREIKLDITIVVQPHVTFHLQEMKTAKNTKIQTQYSIFERANVYIHKFFDTSFVREHDVFYLNGYGATVDVSTKGILKEKSTLDMMVYHNFPATNSTIDNQLITIQKGLLKLYVTTIVYPKMRGCKANQNNRILKENKENSMIQPILLIEENDIEASHNAYIAPIDKEMLYYFYTRGLDEKTAKKIYMKGFLKGDFYNADKYIKKYWR